MASSSPLCIDHTSKSPSSPRYQDVGIDHDGLWRLIDRDRPRRNRRIRNPFSRSLILYLSLVALFVILLLNHRSIHQYVEPTRRQLSRNNGSSSANVRSASNTHFKKKTQSTHSWSHKNKDQKQQHFSTHSRHINHQNKHGHQLHQHSIHGSSQDITASALSLLREEFETWVKNHKRNYGSKEETEKRWHIWKENHYKTIEKNKVHGPCKVTQKHVFGTNHFKDLTSEEFRSQYLTGYGGPRFVDHLAHTNMHHTNTTSHLHPLSSTYIRHESVHKKYLQHIQNSSWYHHHPSHSLESSSRDRILASVNPPQYFSANSTTCKWYEVNCWLQSMVGTYKDTVTSIGKHREPKYDAESYPTGKICFIVYIHISS